ncbi:hypothetical protein Xcel_2942 [Xylanimonas cellulosilytica DSM 15894]|uniref:LytR/CpsA/Psr regulator C-terminal domain-containing protein n=1 Tax=Xylanimonas cellulosilytica (strain DSM 15894 / JCM 12276 / CECT 5975 / KCTC 9989 / LMG 20990 / NBRC 107835 / XIL07) TaxID=446471 RepID=D1BZ51_XYLCX|nr:LytR C-terminal domain-containing protein [Xylanimonas cellulosilytica]ACZ31948.1 hypothetical protein Xcel_2942 [Xylanimonas cellulosilytica DSM 15894]
MSRSQYPYPPDEFDVRGPDDAPVGVHRAPRTRWSSLWPFLLVAVVAVAVAVGGVMFLSRDTGTADDANEPDTTVTEPVDGAGDGEEPADGEVDGEVPADGETPADGEEPDGESPADGGADLAALLEAANLGAHVRVLNDSGISGEAGRGKEALEAHGFTQVEAGNLESGTSPEATSVWYTADRADTAAAVAAALGIPAENVTEQPIRTGDVVVIVKSALTPAG